MGYRNPQERQKMGFLWQKQVSHRCREHGGEALQNLMGGLSQYMGEHGGALNAVKKNMWGSWFDSKVASYKLASLQIYWKKNIFEGF